VIELTGSRSPIVFAPLPADDPKQRRPDITLARDRLGWNPAVQLREGLARTISYFETLLGAGASVEIA
jgi:UDP-glucuronate decarboxylase